jgi:hypothetical protein
MTLKIKAMHKTVEGVFENGKIIFTEPPPIQTKSKVFITFLDFEKSPVSKLTLGSWKGMYSIPDNFNEPMGDLKDYM